MISRPHKNDLRPCANTDRIIIIIAIVPAFTPIGSSSSSSF
jgi:hypothetical protein